MLAFLWRKNPTPQEMMDKVTLDLKMGVRGLERAQENLDSQNKTLINKAKNSASQGKTQETKMLINQLVRYRGAHTKMSLMIIKLEDLQVSVQIMKTVEIMQKAMIDVTKALMKMNNMVKIEDYLFI